MIDIYGSIEVSATEGKVITAIEVLLLNLYFVLDKLHSEDVEFNV